MVSLVTLSLCGDRSATINSADHHDHDHDVVYLVLIYIIHPSKADDQHALCAVVADGAPGPDSSAELSPPVISSVPAL